MNPWSCVLIEKARQPFASEAVRFALSPSGSEGMKKPHTTLEIDSFVMDTRLPSRRSSGLFFRHLILVICPVDRNEQIFSNSRNCIDTI